MQTQTATDTDKTRTIIEKLRHAIPADKLEVLKEFKERLMKHADKCAEVELEIASLDETEPQLRKQAENIIASLADTISPEKLVLLDVNSPELDNDTQNAVRILSGLRMKLELIPGVRAKQQKKLTEIKGLIGQELHKMTAKMGEIGRELLAAQEAKIKTLVLDICGNDWERAKPLVEAIVEKSELKKWADFFQHYSGSFINDLPKLRDYILKFEAGKNVSNG